MSFFRSYSVRIALAGLGLILHPGTVNSQTGTWTVPASGYVLDSVSQSIRPVQGFVGAAVLGSSVFGEIDWASLAPNQKSALAERNGFLIWIPDLAAPERWQTLDRLPEVQQAFWAADASRAALLTKGDQLIWLTNFNSAPVPLSTWNLVRSGRPGLPREQVAWTILAADSAADKVLLAARTGQTWNLWLASASEASCRRCFFPEGRRGLRSGCSISSDRSDSERRHNSDSYGPDLLGAVTQRSGRDGSVRRWKQALCRGPYRQNDPGY
jgi:hypothetical protein